MSHHDKETFALTELMSSINFSPRELRRLRFEADEGLISHSEADERLATQGFWKWVDRNTVSGLPSRPYARCGGISKPGYEAMDESKSWMRREMDALKRELKDIIDGKEKREGKGTKWTDNNDQDDAGEKAVLRGEQANTEKLMMTRASTNPSNLLQDFVTTEMTV